MTDIETRPRFRGRPRRLLVDSKYRERMFIFATHSDLFNTAEVARWMGVDRGTADRDLQDVLALTQAQVIK